MEKEATLIKFDFSNIINQVSQDTRLIPDLMKSENGNNFRAISEKAILDVLDPILRKNNIYYVTWVRDSHLEIREAYGAKGKKLQFCAWLTLSIEFIHNGEMVCRIDSVGQGIDDNDKAMGKAYTYAIKYGLLKLFRLRYGDDPDFEASTPLLTEPKAHAKSESIKAAKDDEKKSHGKTKADEGPSLKQTQYISGLMNDKKVDQSVIKKHLGFGPYDKITMAQARDIIKFLQEYEPEEDITEDDLPW